MIPDMWSGNICRLNLEIFLNCSLWSVTWKRSQNIRLEQGTLCRQIERVITEENEASGMRRTWNGLTVLPLFPLEPRELGL